MYQLSLLLFIFLCALASYTDIRYNRIPDSIIKSAIFLRITASFFGYIFFNEGCDDFFWGFLSAFLITLPLFLVSELAKKLTGRPAFGGGDIKLLFCAGLFFYPYKAFLMLALVLLLASVTGIVIKRKTGSSSIPFAPSVLFAELFIILYCSGLL